MELNKKKTLLRILEEIQFIRGNVDALIDIDKDRLELRADYINDLLNALSLDVEVSLTEKV